jgi:hypothetical protein
MIAKQTLDNHPSRSVVGILACDDAGGPCPPLEVSDGKRGSATSSASAAVCDLPLIERRDRMVRHVGSVQRPYTRLCGLAGPGCCGPRERSASRRCPAAKCRCRATTLYEAVRVRGIGIVWVRANGVAGGGRRARNADLEQRPYTRLCGSAGSGSCGFTRTAWSAVVSGHGMPIPSNDPIRGCAGLPGRDGVGPHEGRGRRWLASAECKVRAPTL